MSTAGRFRSGFHVPKVASGRFVPTFPPRDYMLRVLDISPTKPIGLWTLGEWAGTTSFDFSGQGNNGAYTGVTLGQDGIGDRRTSTKFDGSTSFDNIYSSNLNTVFNNAEMTLAIWGKVNSASVWTDAVARYVFRIATDVNNAADIRKTTTNNQILFNYAAGGTLKQVADTSLNATLSFFHLAMTVSKSADQMRAYINGNQVGATQSTLGAWVGSLGSTTCIIGAVVTTPTNVWSGPLAYASVWPTPLNATQIAQLALVAV